MSTDVIVTTPSLLKQLRLDGYEPVPNYPEPLIGKIVTRFADAVTGEPRDVTDWEMAGRRLLPPQAEPSEALALGLKIRQVWYFTVGTRVFRFNEYYEQWNTHFGLQEVTCCRDCGERRGQNINQPAVRLCRRCWLAQSRSPRCPTLDCACSTAYQKDGCRCPACRTWWREYQRVRRAGINLTSPYNNHLQETNSGVPVPDGYVRTSEVYTQHVQSAAWTWLPDRLRATLAAYEEWLVMWEETLERRTA